MGEGQGSWGGRLAAGLGGCAVGVVAMVALGAAIAPSPGEATPNRVVVQPEAWPVEQQMVPCAVRMDAARAWGESASGELAALEFSEKLLRGEVTSRSRLVIDLDGAKLSFRSEPNEPVKT